MHQLVFDLPPAHRMTEMDFLESDCNAEALAWLRRWPAWPSPCLILHGPKGSGKTHLAHIWQVRSHAKALSPEAVTEMAPAPARGDAFILEHAERMKNEAALFHFLNRISDAGAYVLLTSECAPAQWNILLPDLRSRLRACAAVALHAPDDMLLAALLVKLMRDRQLQVGQEVVDYLTARLPRDFASVRSIVERLDHAALTHKREITVPLARMLLNDTEQ